MIPRAVLVVLSLSVGQPARAADPKPPEATPMKLTPTPTHPFVHGPATDSPELASWLERQAGSGLRLPVTVELSASRGEVSRAALATRKKDAPPVTLDDSRLGISLADRARQACADAAHCTLWLDGRMEKGVFAVTRVGPALTAAELEDRLFAARELPGARAALVAQLDLLATGVTPETTDPAAKALVAAGKESIPLLIASLDDGRPHLLGLTTVGARCQKLLYAVVTPTVTLPEPPHFKVASEQVLYVADWPAFWAARQHKTLTELHDELRPLVRRYWLERGTTQTVPQP
jgi:hypothetical protein